MKKIALIGATGSIGRQVCAVVRRHPDKFKIESMVANDSGEEFLALVREFKPAYAALRNTDVGKKIAGLVPDGVRFACGEQAAEEAVFYGDVVFVAASGFAGLKYSLKTIEAGKDLEKTIRDLQFQVKMILFTNFNLE